MGFLKKLRTEHINQMLIINQFNNCFIPCT